MLEPLTTSDYVVLLGSAGAMATAVVAIIALWYASGQVREARKIAHLDSLLSLDEAFRRHNKIHKLLQPDFKWGGNKGGPDTPDEWFMVTSYMGLFERVNFLIDLGVQELPMVDKFYGYRVYNIVSNDTIRKTKLEDKALAVNWEEFIKLWLRLKAMHEDWNGYPNVTLVER